MYTILYVHPKYGRNQFEEIENILNLFSDTPNWGVDLNYLNLISSIENLIVIFKYIFNENIYVMRIKLVWKCHIV